MKSDDRHRLSENELQKVVASTTSSLEKYSTTIVAVICGVLLISAASVWWSRQTTASSSAAWTLLERAENVQDFADIADKNKDSLVGYWAKLREAESYLRTGSDLLFSDRELANSDLKRAREAFESLIGVPSIEPTIRERAEWGLAQVFEATADEDTTKAIEAYQRLINDYPQTIYMPFAEERITTLKTGGAKDFYAWFSKQSPKPAEVRPRDGALKAGGLEDLLPSPSNSDDGDEAKESKDPDQTTTDSAVDVKKEDDKPASTPNSDDASKSEKKPETPEEKKPEEKNP
ncbi:MAG: tetratricopeptide repeat protein [Planctomycetes bacterium]|nr:tetratricopeptide repeat protein [Planctomycetota bacterium]